MTREILSLVGIIAVVLLVLGGSYVFTRWAGRGLGGGWFAGAGGSRMRLVDRLAIGRDQSLLVAQVGTRHLLLGASPAGVTLLAELTEEEGAQWHMAPAEPERQSSPDFGALLRQLRRRNTEDKRGGPHAD